MIHSRHACLPVVSALLLTLTLVTGQLSHPIHSSVATLGLGAVASFVLPILPILPILQVLQTAQALQMPFVSTHRYPPSPTLQTRHQRKQQRRSSTTTAITLAMAKDWWWGGNYNKDRDTTLSSTPTPLTTDPTPPSPPLPSNVPQDQQQQQQQQSPAPETVDVIVIGAGIGGLSCAALTAKYGLYTLCVEAHDTPGGVAHSFDRFNGQAQTSNKKGNVPFRFDSGPSLLSGMSAMGTNPLRQVLDALDVADEVQWRTYDGWIIHDQNDQTSFKLTTGDCGAWEKAIEQKAGVPAREAFVLFQQKLLEPMGLSEASTYIPPFALRGGYAAVRSLAKYMGKLLQIGSKGALLTGPFAKVMDLNQVHDPFVRYWFDYLSFALSGLDAAHTQAASVAYMMRDLHRPGAVLDYPMGGMHSLIQALVTGLERHGGTLSLNSRVERLLLDESSNGNNVVCKGVVLHNGRVIYARKGVVCNAPLWNMARLLVDSVDATASPTSNRDKDHASSDSIMSSATSNPRSSSTVVQTAVNEIVQQAKDMTMTGSFMHLHLGIPKAGLPDDLECHHSVLDMSRNVTAEQNLVIISIPTVFDASLAPEGYHVVHAYTAACDDFVDWEPFLEEGHDSGKVGANPNTGAASAYARSAGYDQLKERKAEALWQALERVIPDVRQRAKMKGSVVLVGTPLTHRRYNQRYRGTYGPSNNPGKDVWALPGATTKIRGLLACGDTTFPGIGLPGVAASGTIAANSLVSVKAQSKLMNELRKKGALQ